MSDYVPQKPKTLAELRKLVKPLRNVAKERKQNLSKLDKLATWITNHVGTMGFFLIIFAWTVIWLGWNMFAPKSLRFDPYPGFVLWLFLSNMIQIFLMPLIMIGQNLQSQHSDARAEADFDVNTRSETEIETILLHLENQNQLIMEILKRLDKKGEEK
ncbi:MAG: rane protein-like protein [Bacteroidetes bacterium]|nr:rane protein-like protein [Bacteroidota bacterium]